tara:strand:- start:208 stop:735 length:528 start_codon:yes stop_codon:yes gene_type:complete
MSLVSADDETNNTGSTGSTGSTGGSRQIDWVTIAVTLVALAWASWYVWSTRNNPDDEAEAAWLITPILIAAWATAPFVIWSAIGPFPQRLQLDRDEGLGVAARYRFVISLPVLAGLIWLLGFIAATIIYLPAIILMSGERRPLLITAMTLGMLALIYLGFDWALGVKLPLWPMGF